MNNGKMSMNKKRKEPELDSNDVADGARQAWLAGIGALFSTWDGLGDFANKLVERGETVEQDGQRLVRAKMKKTMKTMDRAESGLNRQWRDLLERLGIPTLDHIEKMDYPTRADLEELNQRIVALNRSLTQLRKLEQPQIDQAEAIAATVDTLAQDVQELKALEEPQAKETEALAGKIGTLTRKVNEIQKTQKQ